MADSVGSNQSSTVSGLAESRENDVPECYLLRLVDRRLRNNWRKLLAHGPVRVSVRAPDRPRPRTRAPPPCLPSFGRANAKPIRAATCPVRRRSPGQEDLDISGRVAAASKTGKFSPRAPGREVRADAVLHGLSLRLHSAHATPTKVDLVREADAAPTCSHAASRRRHGPVLPRISVRIP